MIRTRIHSDQDGFTLFEAIVALAILTLGLGAFYRSVAGGASGERRLERATAALQIARSRLAAEGIERALTVGVHSGTDAGGLRWTVSVQPYRDGPTAGPAAYLVTSAVAMPGATQPMVELTTVKLSAAP